MGLRKHLHQIKDEIKSLHHSDAHTKREYFLAKLSGVGPTALRHLFEEAGQSQEKIRYLINLLFVPLFRPEFLDDATGKRLSIQDVELVSSSKSGSTQLPIRMFDVSSGNLIEWPAIGPLGQYAMLSHRWKGEEINLGDIMDARKKDAERLAKKLEDCRDGGQKIILEHSKKSDADRVLEQAALDVQQQAKILESLLKASSTKWDVAKCLEMRFRSKNAQEDLHDAQNGYEEAYSKLKFAEVERQVFSGLLTEMTQKLHERKGGPSCPPNEAARSICQENHPDIDIAKSSLDDPVEKAKDIFDKANEKKDKATQEEKEVHEDMAFFSQNTRIREEVDKVTTSLQKWKSSIKIKQSIAKAKDIFQKNLFRHRDNCYLWLDTCCIDKRNDGELSESLALMGDWYEKAEFTLVQLEDKVNDSDAIHDWSEFIRLDGIINGDSRVFKADQKKKRIRKFSDIEHMEPEWAQRGWTMQELVMSKTTFYVNEEWEPLSRPVESLGIFYYLIPYIRLYIRACSDESRSNDVHSNQSNNSNAPNAPYPLSDLSEALANCEADTPWMELLNATPDKRPDLQEIRNALILINFLDRLGVDFPREMDVESAPSKILEATFTAARRISNDWDSSEAKLMAALPERPGHGSDSTTKTTEVIRVLLRQLVMETHTLIMRDREYVAKFGQVTDLEDWTKGTKQSQFSTMQVMALSSKRKITKLTDHVYALMGVLGVRFPTFPAEGYQKALSRLLDEVVIAHNDVSIFNWSGIDMGSPIRGRSLYPSSHNAYTLDRGSGSKSSLILSQTFQGKMKKKTDIYKKITNLLFDIIRLAKDNGRENLQLDWLEKFASATSSMSFEHLGPQTDNMRKIVEYISYTSHPKIESAEDSETHPLVQESFRAAKSIFHRKRSKKESDSPTPKTESAQDSEIHPLVQEGLRAATSFLHKKRSRKESDSSLRSKFMRLSNGEKASPLTAEEEMHERNSNLVKSYLDAMVEAATTGNPVAGNAFTLPGSLENKSSRPTIPNESPLDANAGYDLAPSHLLSPHPIIVNTAGIEGVFDIQRIFITMLEPEKLRLQIALSAGPRQKISGWCLISTGFVKVVVNFLCESHILEKELDAIEGITEQVLREKDRFDGKTRRDSFASHISIKDQGSNEPELENDATSPSQPKDESAEDVKMVSRMIKFIQETDLDLVAGEWVLARFSGVPGAKWFLCHLELGTTHHYYGHRIATSAIDFHNAVPEAGLVNVWENYMARKKNRLCMILRWYLFARRMDEEKKDSLGHLIQLGKRTMKGDFSRHPAKETSSKHDETSELEGTASHDRDEEQDDFPDTLWGLMDGILQRGVAAMEAAGETVIESSLEMISNMGAATMERTLSKAALKETPEILHAAVENLSDNGEFLPSMCHWGNNVHMF